MKIGNALNTFGGWQLRVNAVLSWALLPFVLVLGLYYAFWHTPAPGEPKPSRAGALLMSAGAALFFFAVGTLEWRASTATGDVARLVRQTQVFT